MELLGAILKLSTSLSKLETSPLREGLVFRRPVIGISGAPESLPMAALDMNEARLDFLKFSAYTTKSDHESLEPTSENGRMGGTEVRAERRNGRFEDVEIRYDQAGV